jgi:hypothetical protein
MKHDKRQHFTEFEKNWTWQFLQIAQDFDTVFLGDLGLHDLDCEQDGGQGLVIGQLRDCVLPSRQTQSNFFK